MRSKNCSNPLLIFTCGLLLGSLGCGVLYKSKIPLDSFDHAVYYYRLEGNWTAIENSAQMSETRPVTKKIEIRLFPDNSIIIDHEFWVNDPGCFYQTTQKKSYKAFASRIASETFLNVSTTDANFYTLPSVDSPSKTAVVNDGATKNDFQFVRCRFTKNKTLILDGLLKEFVESQVAENGEQNPLGNDALKKIIETRKSEPGMFIELAHLKRTDPMKETILLTGFEPFGGADTNPSFDMLQYVPGEIHHNYETLKLPVVWGEPLKALDSAICDKKPVAVIAFGQGKPGQFSIETIARNARAQYNDNAKRLPESPSVIQDGRPVYISSSPVNAIETRLIAEGYPVRLSTDAGQYLCEETLYSLEYLRDSRYPWLDVLFIHVPPVGTTKYESKTGDDIRYYGRFVRAVIDAWSATRR